MSYAHGNIRQLFGGTGMSEIIDKKKLLDWVESEITESNETAMKWVAYNVMKGKFDDHSAQDEIAKLNSWIKNGEAKERHYDELREMFNAMEQRALAAEKERDELRKQFDMAYWFVKRYYMTFIHFHTDRKDISHNEQFFIYGDANSIIGKIEGKKPNGSAVEVKQH